MKFNTFGKHKLLAAGFCLLPLAGLAAEDSDNLSYGYLEVDYINFDVDQPNEGSIFSEDFDNGGGYGVSLSVPLGETFFVYADYSDTESDFTFVDNTSTVVPGNTDLLRLNLGLGFIMPMSDTTDLVMSGGYADIDYGSFRVGATSDNSLDDLDDDPSDGYTVDVKLRSQLSQSIEGSIGARYTDIQDADGFSLLASVMYEFSPNWGLNLSLDAGDELISYGAGIRYSF